MVTRSSQYAKMAGPNTLLGRVELKKLAFNPPGPSPSTPLVETAPTVYVWPKSRNAKGGAGRAVVKSSRDSVPGMIAPLIDGTSVEPVVSGPRKGESHWPRAGAARWGRTLARKAAASARVSGGRRVDVRGMDGPPVRGCRGSPATGRGLVIMQMRRDRAQCDSKSDAEVRFVE